MELRSRLLKSLLQVYKQLMVILVVMRKAIWGALTDAEISPILKAVMSPFFEVTYPDPMEGAIVTKTFYVGDRSAPAYSWHDKLPKWEGLTMSFIER